MGVQYRRFGALTWQVSALGFGCMRLPVMAGDPQKVDMRPATRMLRYAIDHGVNYVDSGYSYHEGQSEVFLGCALKDGYRDKVRIATKLPCWRVQTAQDFDRVFSEQLSRLQTDCIDFYLLHGLNQERWPRMRDLGFLKWGEKAVAAGRIGRLGFSFHDKYPLFQEIVDAYDGWAMCQIQYNYVDVENQAGERGLKYAAAKGLAVAIMEPLLGGRLLDPPKPVRDIWDTAQRRRTPADWALQWLWNQPEVSVVLSGMSAMSQVEENVTSADMSRVGGLTARETELVGCVREKYRELGATIPCTKCGYCMPCPQGVDIPRNFAIYNEGMTHSAPDGARRSYAREGQSGKPDATWQASYCKQCRLCEEKCPQTIPVSQWMPVIHQVLGEGVSSIDTQKPAK
jgi:uncharacterized protein